MLMKKNIISMLIAALMLIGMMPNSSAYQLEEVTDLIHSSGTQVRDGVTVKTHYSKNSGTEDAPVKQHVTTDSHVSYYGDPEAIFDGSTTGNKNECIVTYNYEVYFQIDLGQCRTITDIIYTVKSANDPSARKDDMNNFIIQLSNDPEFSDDLSDSTDVVMAYAKGNDGDAQNVHTAEITYEKPYRYIRLSALNNEFMKNKRELCVAEFEVYGYLNEGYSANVISSGAMVTDPDGVQIETLTNGNLSDDWTRTKAPFYVTMDLGAVYQLSHISVRPYNNINLKYRKGLSVWASNDPNFGENKYTILYDGTDTAIGNYSTREIDVDINKSGYQYIRVVNTLASPTAIGLSEITVEGYNLFDTYACLDISDDESMVYAHAKKEGEYTLILAEYDREGKCLNIVSVRGDEIATMPANKGSLYKAFLWTSLESSAPATKSVFLIK